VPPQIKVRRGWNSWIRLWRQPPHRVIGKSSFSNTPSKINSERTRFLRVLHEQEQAGAVTADIAMAEKAIAMVEAEEDLLEVAVRDHGRLVYRIAYAVLRNTADAEDAAQEAFLRVLRSRKTMSGIQDQKAWLARIAWRVAVERRRQTTQAAARSDEAGDHLPSPRHGAERALLDAERTELLQQLVLALPDALRDSLVLSALEELSPREVGAILDLSEAAVRSRIFRARQILRERFAVLMGSRK
jgi:RNA polymerase sigma-70 factor (ECF subfamily)